MSPPPPRPAPGLASLLAATLPLQRLGLAAAARRFAAAGRQPAAVQGRLLRDLLAGNRATQYGAAHHFPQVTSRRAYQARVPLVDAEALRPWLQQAAAGADNVLTAAPPVALRRTAGYCGGPRLLPVTAALRAQLGRALRPWLADWLRAQPQLWGGDVVWCVAPPLPLPRGAALPHDDGLPSALLGGLAGRALGAHLLPVAERQSTSWSFEALLALLEAAQLRAIVAPNPLHLAQLVRGLQENLPDLLAALPPARAAAIRAGLDALGALGAAALWPQLRVVAMWRDGAAAAAAHDVARFFAPAAVRSPPLALQEAVLTVPLWDQEDGMPLAVDSHFFEFLDAEAPRRAPLFADELRQGGLYQPVVSTAGGLYRFRTGEVVRCSGTWQGTPRLQYVDKAAPLSSRHGEALSPQRLQRALEEARVKLGLLHRFALCAPLPPPQSGYCLYVDAALAEADTARLAASIEASLAREHAYWLARHQGQLAPLQVVPVRNAWERYSRAMTELGIAPRDVKPTTLDGRAVWPLVFAPF